MNPGTKNKLLTWLVLLLLIANAATLVLFWTGKRKNPPASTGTPNEFLVKELKLDDRQQQALTALVKEHRRAVDQLRGQVKAAKDSLFDLVKKENLTDSARQSAAAAVSRITEQIDLLTLDHFRKIRALCNPEQQRQFDEILHRVAAMLGAPRPPRDGRGGPPPEGDRPPPPGQ